MRSHWTQTSNGKKAEQELNHTYDCEFLLPLAFPPDLPPVILMEKDGCEVWGEVEIGGGMSCCERDGKLVDESVKRWRKRSNNNRIIGGARWRLSRREPELMMACSVVPAPHLIIHQSHTNTEYGLAEKNKKVGWDGGHTETRSNSDGYQKSK